MLQGTKATKATKAILLQAVILFIASSQLIQESSAQWPLGPGFYQTMANLQTNIQKQTQQYNQFMQQFQQNLNENMQNMQEGIEVSTQEMQQKALEAAKDPNNMVVRIQNSPGGLTTIIAPKGSFVMVENGNGGLSIFQ